MLGYFGCSAEAGAQSSTQVTWRAEHVVGWAQAPCRSLHRRAEDREVRARGLRYTGGAPVCHSECKCNVQGLEKQKWMPALDLDTHRPNLTSGSAVMSELGRAPCSVWSFVSIQYPCKSFRQPEACLFSLPSHTPFFVHTMFYPLTDKPLSIKIPF